jgi:uncharacterized membrane protein YgaE (UPF0421/DUF939 family)
MIEKVILHLDQFRDRLFSNGKVTDKLIIVIGLSLVIAYLLSPKISFRTQRYFKGDIIQNDIIAEKDLLLPDLESTELKKEQILSNLSIIFDYSPNTIEKTSEKIRETIEVSRQHLTNLQKARTDLDDTLYKKGIEHFNARQQNSFLEKELKILEKYHRASEEILKKLKTITMKPMIKMKTNIMIRKNFLLH